MSVYMKLNKARAKFHTLKLAKTGYNKFAGYNYFELGDFLVPAMQVLDEFDLCAYISFGKEVATMRIVNMVDGQYIEITSPMSTAALKGCHEVQNLGAVQTYLRRYLWVAALEIVEHDALDSSQPLADKKGVPKLAALSGIGAELSVEDRAWADDVAGYLCGLVRNGKEAKAIEEWETYEVQDEALSLYVQSKMDPKTRKALGFTYTAKAA